MIKVSPAGKKNNRRIKKSGLGWSEYKNFRNRRKQKNV